MGHDKGAGAVQDVASAKRRIKRFHDELKGKNYFEIFGTSSAQFDLARVRTAYKDLAKQWHVDAYPGLDLGAEQALLNQVFAQITEGYETLTDTNRRAEYTLRLQREAKGLSTDVAQVLRAEQLFDEAVVEIRRKRWDKAAELLKEAIQLHRDDPLYNVQLAWVNFNAAPKDTRVIQRATDDMIRATEKQENLPLAYQYLGQIAFARDNYPEAKRWWKKCLEWDAKNIDASRGLRLVAQREEKPKSGFAQFVHRILNKR